MKKKPPPKSPQGFNIHEPAPRLAKIIRETKEKERERKREREASEKVNNIGKEVLKFDTHLCLRRTRN